uniref:ZP domain-containing protein n=1 Tax=Romanomermis culicivorax TaxID=13658 RepID=A0A915J3B9_ROMCU
MNHLVAVAIILAILDFRVSRAGEIDNHLVGLPVVDCQDVAVSLTFTTAKPFTGRVYVKGLVEDDRCSRNFATTTDQSKFSMQIPQGDCNMQRQRVSGALEGIVFSLVIVVSFHGTFETMNDRAFRCMCFFRNIKRVTNFLDVSMLGTTELLDTAKTANCFYSMHAESPSGPLVRYAKVGDRIFHVWECDDQNQGILVHSCWVNDGRGARFDLVDVDGCAIDPIIQPDIKYDSSLNKAFVESWAYKFSDTSVLDYQCVVELCKKSQGECNGLTPPVCGRGKRSIDHHQLLPGNLSTRRHDDASGPLSENEIDVTANIHVLDTLMDETDAVGGGMVPDDFLRDLNGRRPTAGGRVGSVVRSLGMVDRREIRGQMCMTATTLASMVISTILLLFIATVATVALWMDRRKREKANKTAGC